MTETGREWLAYHGYRGLQRLAMTLPERQGRRLFVALGRLAFRTMPRLRATVAANMAGVLGVEPEDPRARAAALEAFELYARYWFDAFAVRRLTREQILARTSIVGREHIDRALEQGRGVIAVLPHMGNWDVAGAWVAAAQIRIVAVAEELRPRRLFDLFVAHREALGLRIIGLSGEGHVGSQLKTFLADNWLVALVADRDLTGRGIAVELFGRPWRVPAGPALLSLSTGAPLIPCSVRTLPDGWEISFDPPLDIQSTGNTRADVAALSRLMAERFERAIAAHPTDWHMFQPAFPAPREPAASGAGR